MPGAYTEERLRAAEERLALNSTMLPPGSDGSETDFQVEQLFPADPETERFLQRHGQPG